jgi:predicted Zn-dependent protease
MKNLYTQIISKRTRVLFLFGLMLMMVLPALFAGCKSVETATNLGSAIGVATGMLTDSQADSLKKTSLAVARSFQDITPEQEYYIGRAVGAVILEKYRPYQNKSAITYVNVLGQTLAGASDLPETFGGYHFLILDADEINAFAAPGGLIFITRGMLACCLNEDALAAVLAHEIGHVQSKHGLQAIKKSRITTALTTIGVEGTKTFAGEGLATLTQTFGESVTDITKTLVNNGYSRELEREADQAAILILERVGYNPNGLVDMLQEMNRRLKPGGLDFAKTHPTPESRIEDISSAIGPYAPVIEPKPREIRFNRTIAKKY